ncbi:Hypothetical_protein [Hexamita inflata]|uniref:Hypothetical_protein n=1 Tax=Hexamita inflata TaxID=28002 RepID=A0ABP1GWP0_9EUKA
MLYKLAVPVQQDSQIEYSSCINVDTRIRCDLYISLESDPVLNIHYQYIRTVSNICCAIYKSTYATSLYLIWRKPLQFAVQSSRIGEITCFEVWQPQLISFKDCQIQSHRRNQCNIKTADEPILITYCLYATRKDLCVRIHPLLTLYRCSQTQVDLNRQKNIAVSLQRHVARNETDVSWSPQKQYHCVDAYDLIQRVTKWRFGRKCIGFEQSLRGFRNLQLHQHN